MGVFDFLKPKSPMEKASKDLQEPYAQPDVRQAAMDKLFEMKSAEAYRVLLKRFTYNANGQIADESEKRSLVDRLAEVGEPALPAIQAFIKTEKAITFPIQALQRILDEDGSRSFLIETLREKEPQDHRTTQAKVTLLAVLSESARSEDAEAVVPYLDDHADDVQVQAIDVLEALASERAAKGALVAVCCSDVHGPRVRRRAASALANLGWNVKADFEGFDPELKSEWKIDKSGRLQR
ncbi:MAG: hypothetical protein AAGD10_17005 [Myxococcota bacterium]